MVAVEAAAAVLTLACVWLMSEERVVGWPTAILSGLLYFYVFARARLYSEVLLQTYFIVTSVWGWYAWTHAGSAADAALAISRLSAGQAALWAAVSTVGVLALGGGMRRWTRAALPFWDATITVLSLVAQYLLAQKVLETWAIWMAVDAMAIGVYLARRLRLSAVLYAVLFVLAGRGLLEWLGKI